MNTLSIEIQQVIAMMFGCGIEPTKLKASIEALSQTEQERLYNVARRLGLTLKLRYETVVYVNGLSPIDKVDTYAYEELPSLESYLLFSCFDTLSDPLSNATRRKSFPKWLAEQQNDECMAVTEVTRKYQEYRQLPSIRSSLRQRLWELPEWFKAWLLNSVDFRSSNLSLEPASVQLSWSDFADRFLEHFYEIRRNDHSHSSLVRSVRWSENISPPTETSNSWIYDFANTPHLPSNGITKWAVVIREGLDEGTILRLIIVMIALQKLRIEVTEEILEKNQLKLAIIDSLYHCIAEIEENSWNTERLFRISENTPSNILMNLTKHSIPLYRSVATRTLINRLRSNTLENGIKSLLIDYASNTEECNRRIREFNKNLANLFEAGKQHSIDERVFLPGSSSKKSKTQPLLNH